MSKVNEQQQIINKTVDTIETSIKAIIVLIKNIDERIQQFTSIEEINKKEDIIIALQNDSSRLEVIVNKLLVTSEDTKKRILKLPIGFDQCQYQHYHHQCEMIESITQSYLYEWMIRDTLIQQLTHSTSESVIQFHLDSFGSYNNSLAIQTQIDMLKTCRSFSGLANRNLR